MKDRDYKVCKECKDRFHGCHDKCIKYTAIWLYRHEGYEELQKEREINGFLGDIKRVRQKPKAFKRLSRK